LRATLLVLDRVRALVSDLDRWSRANRVPRVGRRAIEGFLAHEALQYAGSMAYFGVLSIFQLLVLGVVAFSLALGEAEARRFVLEQVQAGTPIDPGLVNGVIDAVIASRGGMSIVGAVFLLWSALGVFGALSQGIGRAFEAAEPRPFLQDKLLGLFLMALTGVLAVGSMVIGIVTGAIQAAAEDVVGEAAGAGTLLWLIGLIAPIVLIFVAFLVIYRFVPNRRVSFGEVWPGAVVATVLWTLLRFGFTFYATRVANYDSAFGPISTGITLLAFLYFASVVVLLGAEVARANVIDAEAQRRLRQAGVSAGGAAAAAASVTPGPVPVPSPSHATHRGGLISRLALLIGGAVAGVFIGRWTKRDED
jgi:membrane protein